MADVRFHPHFRPRPLPLGPDWPRQRPVASRCGTVGATPLSVGGRRGKMDAATLTYDTLRFAEFEDFPETSEPVWILGRKYSISTEKDEILSDVASRLWFTYRKNFPAIDWRWTQRKRQPDSYFSVLNAFIDRKDSYYSIHQIAQMGVGEGKSIGQWYGPNTVAQVLKKLAVFDTWSALAVHVAMDNTVVMEDIRRLCRGGLPCAGAAALPADPGRHCNGFPAGAEVSNRLAPWRPLVLLIPLRLGLTDINEAYVETLKHCFMMPQSLGVIGGKPNSAHYFIGYVGEELIYLDPHTTQPAVEFADSCFIPDESFHCQHPPSRMGVRELDPSIAVGFFCQTEEDFDDWCQRVRKVGSGSPACGAGGKAVSGLGSHLAACRGPRVVVAVASASDLARAPRFLARRCRVGEGRR
ncbi:cysteine protease ATG4B isoform X3 [Lynx rufus]|uniref:cysteine protease ATG4B isoform X3 n=1 Tax=Lynx rufus TaxID=61384 RepID=UPI001F123E1B|nr:cysteine protease ATG4B isoform X3 [Lynx rufus]